MNEDNEDKHRYTPNQQKSQFPHRGVWSKSTKILDQNKLSDSLESI